MTFDLVIALFAGVLLVLSAFSRFLQRISLPGPLLALAAGVLLGPVGTGILRIDDLGIPSGVLLEETARITLAIGLSGVAMRLPHGYWRRNLRWVLVIIGIGMPLMFAVSAGILWGLLGMPLLAALLVGAILAPTDPVVATPIVTGSLAQEKVPSRVRFDISSESGINDGMAYLFVLAPVLLMTSPGEAWTELLTRVLLWEVLVGVAFGAVAGWLIGRLFVLVSKRRFMEKTSYLGFVVPFSLVILGVGGLLGLDAILSVFVAAAVFGQTIPTRDEEREDNMQEIMSRFFLLPVFVLLGMALPWDAWRELGWSAVLAITLAVVGRRLVTLWSLYPLLRRVHDLPETAFLSWFGPIGVSALFYATMAERMTGDSDVFAYVTLAIAVSVTIHGLTTAPASAWLHRHRADGQSVR